MTEKLISQSLDTDNNGYSLTRIHATPSGQVVRIHIFRPFDRQGVTPAATAGVYRHAENEWLAITSLGRNDWYDGTADAVGDEAIVDQLNTPATLLYQQARDILSYGPQPPSHPVRNVYAYSSQMPDPASRTTHISPLKCGGDVVAAYTDLAEARRAVLAVNDGLGDTRAQLGSTLPVDPPDDELLELARRAEGQVRVYIQDNDGTTVDLLNPVDHSVGLGMCLTLNEGGLLRPGFAALFESLGV